MGRLTYWSQIARLPPRTAIFVARARRLAHQIEDNWTLRSATPPRHLLLLVRLARGRTRIVELGTGPGWTAAALALAGRRKVVRTFDPFPNENRERYLGLVGRSRDRIILHTRPGHETDGMSVEMLFIDSSHDQAETVREFNAWRPHLARGAVVAFHDFDLEDWPGVSAAIAELRLTGDVMDSIFVWHAP